MLSNIVTQFLLFFAIFLFLLFIQTIFIRIDNIRRNKKFPAVFCLTSPIYIALTYPLHLIHMGLLTITGNRFQLARSNYHFTLNIKTRNAGVGRYLCYLLDVTVTVLLIALSLRFLLPNTFSSLYEGLDAWTELSRGPIDSSLLINAVSIFADLIINHLILGGLKENAIFFILFAFLLIFNFSLILPETQKSNKLSAFLSIFKVALIIALFNISFALFCNLYLKNDLLYTQLSSTVNYFGMVMIFGMLLAIIGVILYTAIGIICGIIRGIWRFISRPVR